MGRIRAGLVSRVCVLLLFVALCDAMLNVPSASGQSGTIYIRADGSIDPPTANITTSDYITYTFIGNITDSVEVERSNIIVDGNGYMLQGNGSGKGFYLHDVDNVTIKHAEVRGYEEGFYLDTTSNNKILENKITNNLYAVYASHSTHTAINENNMTQNNYHDIMLYFCSRNSISGNMATSPNEACIFTTYSSYNTLSSNDLTSFGAGIRLWFSSNNNALTGNTLRNNWYGIELSTSSNNSIYHNNFINNTKQAYSLNSTDVWDDGYPSGGNYWSNYTGIDADNDGIGDEPYTIDTNNTDRYPLAGSINVFDAGIWDGTAYNVDVVSNSTVLGFQFNPSEGAFLRFNVTGEDGTSGFCRVTIPKNLLWVEDGWTVLYESDPFPRPLSYETFSDENYTFLYFTYTNPSQNGFATVTINGTHVVPEFPPFLIMPLFMIATLLAVLIYKRKHSE